MSKGAACGGRLWSGLWPPSPSPVVDVEVYGAGMFIITVNGTLGRHYVFLK